MGYIQKTFEVIETDHLIPNFHKSCKFLTLVAISVIKKMTKVYLPSEPSCKKLRRDILYNKIKITTIKGISILMFKGYLMGCDIYNTN